MRIKIIAISRLLNLEKITEITKHFRDFIIYLIFDQ